MDEIENLTVWTSFATSDVLNYFKNKEILPIFIARTIKESQLIGQWQGSAVHFGQLAPSPVLLREWKYQGIGDTEFEKKYFSELGTLDLESIITKMVILKKACQAKGLVLIGYGADALKDHRSFLSRFLNESGVLKNSIHEYTEW